MLSFPINEETFRSFSAGGGNFVIRAAGNGWVEAVKSGAPFSREMPASAEIRFGNDASLDFGKRGDFVLSIDVDPTSSHGIELLWPDKDRKAIRSYGLPSNPDPDRLAVRLFFESRSKPSARAAMPAGPLSATIGISADESVACERIKMYDRTLPAGRIIGDLLEGMRLPQQIDSPAGIPAVDEVFSTSFGGYLRLKSNLSCGYSLTGTRALEIGLPELDLKRRLRIVASASFGYNLAGDFEVRAARGENDGWVRFTVCKSRETKRDYAADFSLDSRLELQGLPATPDELLGRILGIDAESLLERFLDAGRYASLEELKNDTGRLVADFLSRHAARILGEPLDEDNLPRFLAAMHSLAGEYRNLDPRVADLYEDALDETAPGEAITRAIDLAAGLTSIAELLRLSGTSAFTEVLELLRRLAGGEIHAVLTREEEFSRIVALVRRVRELREEAKDAPLRDFLRSVKCELSAGRLFECLEPHDTAEKLGSMTEEALIGTVEWIAGKRFEDLSRGDLEKVLDHVKRGRERVERFRDQWHKSLLRAVRQSFKAKLHLAYNRTRAGEDLLDVEILVTDAEGAALARRASRGDFEAVLAGLDARRVRVRNCRFTDELKESARIRVNIFGWSSEGIVNLVQNSEESIEVEPTGLVHLYSSKTYLEKRRKEGRRFLEEVQSRFLLHAVGKSFRRSYDANARYLLDMLESMSVEYRLLERDGRTRDDELARYLEFARELGLLGSEPAAEAARWRRECGGDLGKVSLKYVVRYDHLAVLSAFNFDETALADAARSTMRSLVLRIYAGMNRKFWLPRIGFAYAAPGSYQLFRETVLLDELKSVVLPAWYTGKRPREVALKPHHRQLIERLFLVEDGYVDSLLALSRLVDRARVRREAIPLAELNGAVAAFLKNASRLNDYDENAFFLLFDRLVELGSRGKAKRDSSLTVEINPGRGPLKGKKISKVLTATVKNDN